MKFVCLNCETYMGFEKVEQPAEGSLGVFFACPSCDAKFSMVTNPGETQMVSSLGCSAWRTNRGADSTRDDTRRIERRSGCWSRANGCVFK